LKIVFQFNSKSSGQGVHDAVSIAQKYNGILDGKFYKIQFDSPEDKNLDKLLELVGNLKGSLIFIDNEEGVVASKFMNTFNCPDKLLCKGICNHTHLGYYPLKEFKAYYGRSIKNNVLTTNDSHLIGSISDFLDEIEENHFKLNKELVYQYFVESTEFEKKYCSKYNEEKTKMEVDKLPNEICFITPEKYEGEIYMEEYEGEEKEINKILRGILTNCVIDSKLSIEDILNCSNAISLLSFPSQGNMIQDTDVWVYSYPHIDKFILMKLKTQELEPKITDDQEIIDVVTKEKNLFYLKNPYIELYFQVFDSNDPAAKDYYKILKNL